MKKIINNLYLHTIESMEQKDMEVVNKNINMFLSIYETILNKSKNYGKSEVLKQWTKYVNFLGSKAIEFYLFEELIELIENIYSKSSNYDIDVDLEETIEKLVNVFRDSESYVELNNIPIKKLLKTIYINSREDLFPKYVRIYFSILKNKSLSDEEKDILISNIIISGLALQYSEPKKRIDKKRDIFLILLYTSKYMIDSEDFKRFIKLLDRCKESFVFEELLVKLYLYIGCYLYYLAYKEDLAKEKKYREFIKNHHEIFMVADLIYSDFWDSYEEVKTTLDRWEWFPQGEAKALIMDGVVREYFVFLSLSVGRSDFINRIDRDELFIFLEGNLNNDGNFREKTEENFKIFKEELMGLEVDDNLPELENLKYMLTTRYREIKSEEYQSLKNNIEIIEANINGIKERIAYKIGEIPIFNRISLIENKEANYKKTNVCFKEERIFDLSYFALHKLNKSLVDNVFYRQFEQYVIELLIRNGFKEISIDYRQNNKLEILFDLIQSFSQHKINSLLSGISNSLLYNESENNKMSFQKLSEKLTFRKISHPVWIAFNQDNINLRIKNIEVKLNSLREENLTYVLNKSKVADDLFKLHLTNNIYTYVNEKEAIEYINQTKILFSIFIDIELIHLDKEIGFVVISKKMN